MPIRATLSICRSSRKSKQAVSSPAYMASNVTRRFISADDHIDLRWLPKDLWHQRLPARLRERGPRVIENDKGAFWSWEDQTFSPHGYYTAAQGSGAMWAIERGGVMRPGELRPTTAALRLSDMDPVSYTHLRAHE